jgi:Big-like domain-containing protein
MNTRVACTILLIATCIIAGCANITAPTGGKRDKTPPKLVDIDPPDSLLNTRVKRIEMHFDEYITVADANKEVQISPIISIPPTVVGLNKRVVVKIVDSLLEANTTYRISFGSAIKDLHEGNPFKKYTYTFSTGPYFDSLTLRGTVINALTGFPDSAGITVELYAASDNDSAVVRHKPKYVTKADATGAFLFKGLPKRTFRIYALKDANGNLIYDGVGEMIAFNDSTVTPGDSSTVPVLLRTFAEIPDTASKKNTDSLGKQKEGGLKNRSKQSKKDTIFTYKVNIDTSNSEVRTFDVTRFIKVSFNRTPELSRDKIHVSYYDKDSNLISPAVSFEIDSSHPNELYIKSDWQQNTVYVLQLSKGFAKDTSGKEVMPGRFVFRTFDDDDYGKIKIHLPTKYHDKRYVLLVTSETDTIWQKPVTDTIVNIPRVRPAKYTFRIIVDKNGNGIWDTGDLLGNKQPEEIIPYPEPLNMKAGWENSIDFEQKPQPKKTSDRTGVK